MGQVDFCNMQDNKATWAEVHTLELARLINPSDKMSAINIGQFLNNKSTCIPPLFDNY